MSADNVLDRLRLDGQVAVVTGSGRGIGRGIALGLADAGADVLITARRADDVQTVAAEVRERGRRAVAMPGDIRDFSEQLAAAAVDQLYAQLDAEGYGRRPPWDAVWGQRYASVLDPDGTQVDLYAWLPGQPSG